MARFTRKLEKGIDLTMLNTFIQVRFAKPNDFGYKCKTRLSDPYVLFLVTVAMFFNGSKIPTSVLRNIHTKFGSNWSGSVRGEDF